MITLPREDAVCDHVVSGDDTLVIHDTQRDPRFADNPAINLWKTRFYAGAPLRTTDGLVLGALCLLDTRPRDLDEGELELLKELAADVAQAITGQDASEDGPKDVAENSATTGQRVPK